MSMQKENIGIMDEGYFVPRGQIIDWINDILDLHVTKIEELGAGSVYCQIIDIIHPGKVSMNKVNWKAKNEYEFISNLKILQTAFDKVGIKRYVEVQKLAKAKYQDNLEFIQWLKRYFDLNCGARREDYNPQQRRGNVAVDFSFATKIVVPKSFNGAGQLVPKNQIPGKKIVQNIPAKITQNQQKREIKYAGRLQKSQQKKQPVQKKNWEQMYKQEAARNKQCMEKFKMIRQVVHESEDPIKKIAMVKEILGTVFGDKNQKMEIENQDQENY